MNDSKDEKSEPQYEGSSKSEESSAVLNPEVDSKLEEIIEELPAEKRELVRHTIQEMFVGFMERSSAPQITSEVARILAESADKDNEHKFQFLIQKQKDEAALEAREFEFKREKHTDRFKIVRPIVFYVLAIVALFSIGGVWLCVIGKEVLGASLITGVFAAVFGYLAGIGTSDFFKEDKPQ